MRRAATCTSRPDGAQLYDPPEGAENQINAIPLDDEATYRLYASAKTVAVFQVESSGMMDALKRMKPTCIEDIVALVALYRPGPMENIPKYCEVKNGLSNAITCTRPSTISSTRRRASSSTRNR